MIKLYVKVSELVSYAIKIDYLKDNIKAVMIQPPRIHRGGK